MLYSCSKSSVYSGVPDCATWPNNSKFRRAVSGLTTSSTKAASIIVIKQSRPRSGSQRIEPSPGALDGSPSRNKADNRTGSLEQSSRFNSMARFPVSSSLELAVNASQPNVSKNQARAADWGKRVCQLWPLCQCQASDNRPLTGAPRKGRNLLPA